MYIDSKAISWLVLAGGLFLYLWSIINNEFASASIFMAGTILLWMLLSLSSGSFNNKEFAKILSYSGFLLSISVFFLYGLEEMPYPAGAIIFHSDGIAKALGLSIIASLPLLLFFEPNPQKDKPDSHKKEPESTESSEPALVVDHKDYELADVDDLTSGEFDI